MFVILINRRKLSTQSTKIRKGSGLGNQKIKLFWKELTFLIRLKTKSAKLSRHLICIFIRSLKPINRLFQSIRSSVL
jgi:hypothetical protein